MLSYAEDITEKYLYFIVLLEYTMEKEEERMTSGRKSQYRFDKLLSELDISSLRFLRHKYLQDISHFRQEHNLNVQEYAQTYKELQQRLKMISEELKLREQLSAVRHEPDIYFEGDYLVVSYPSGVTRKYNVLEVNGHIVLSEIYD